MEKELFTKLYFGFYNLQKEMEKRAEVLFERIITKLDKPYKKFFKADWNVNSIEIDFREDWDYGGVEEGTINIPIEIFCDESSWDEWIETRDTWFL